MNNIRVLIVDDQYQVRQGLTTLLNLGARKSGVEVAGTAGNGREAVEKARELQPEVVLMDLEMPEMDGYAATRQIKAEAPAVRVIILSVHAGPEEQEYARQAGADGFVTKGAPYEILLEAIFEAGSGAFNRAPKGETDE